MFKSDPESLTVRKVRAQVVENLDLEENFFTEENWKGKSKDVIQKLAVSFQRLAYTWRKDSADTLFTNRSS